MTETFTFETEDPVMDAMQEAQSEGESVQHELEEKARVIQFAIMTGDISEYLEMEELNEIGSDCVEDYNRDNDARDEWKDRTEKALSAAAQDVPPDKTYPFVGAANVRWPGLTVAAQQFAARAYPAIVKENEAVQVKVLGKDDQSAKATRAERVKTYLNYLIFYRMEDWESDTDILLNQLPVTGCGFRKVYYDPERQAPSACFVNALRLTVPQDAKSLEDAPRITEEFDAFPYQIEERQRAGIYREVDLASEGDEDDQKPRKLIEQHRMIDMDEDGVSEPYIVTCDVETKTVLRIEASYTLRDVELMGERIIRIKRWIPYVKYSFLPDPKGGFYDIGFGHLMGPVNEVINTIINQLLDAGHAEVAGGGFLAAGLRLQGSGQTNVLRWQPGEYKVVHTGGQTIAQSIFERTVPHPSPVLFQLLGLLMEAAQDISSVKDVLTGEAKNGQTATATIALIEQGLQQFTAIYKRVYRSLKQEFKLLYDCISRYGDPEEYARVVDAPGADLTVDFDPRDLDIQPMSDPGSVTNMQKMAKAQFLMQFVGKGLNDQEILKRIFEAADIPEAEALFPPPQPPMPDPRMIAQAEKDKAQAENYGAQAIKNKAEAIKTLTETAGGMIDAGRLRELENPSGDGMGVPSPQQNGGPPAVGMGPGLMGFGNG